jgi:hypothetical protein
LNELIGIDYPIALVQSAFAENLWPEITRRIFYARTYRNLNRQGQLIAEVYDQRGEYIEVQFDDTYDALCFFDPDDVVNQIEEELVTTRECGIIFAVNYENIHTLYESRVTEELYRDALKVIQDYASSLVIPNQIVAGINAYGDLSTSKLKAFNMHPWHTFRIQTTMKVDFDCNSINELSFGYEYPSPIIFTE